MNKPDCYYCFFWQYDMDSDYCAHPKAMEISWAGLSLNRARSSEFECGPEGTLYKPSEKRFPKSPSQQEDR